ncbi:hypothetical protein BN7_3418 [Wickerhamomyces ciferrii]|uniref:Uncharacterized protein n=1 Tax=Wickerhamomyces ciferrii (strain ATCC 14091 / BCRC 22168 / CBS 111 / JCM 3599 / NBRC 0793 / NRRL Y-1031 F-60-10) TaxID=1206466 RepID=K0KRF7_WICCF|nr:uncharacterized protein BN7_3418 [Wickerhamomyces ciferrii]CCH43864.1 hypothetical protein BN7_3418 [Wickerhamomyces ciferrii]
MSTSETEQLKARIAKLEKEIEDLKQVTIFSDIQPYVEENQDKFKQLKISSIGLSYLIKFQKKGILKELIKRVASDLYKDVEDVQLLDPKNGKLLTGDEDLQQFEQDGVFNLDFQYANACGHDHDHEYGSDEDFTDDENFYNSCSCSHPH